MEALSKTGDIDACNAALQDVDRAVRVAVKAAASAARKKHGVKVAVTVESEACVV